uniref:Uncharacterized protein n=1 Tax=Hucho hucho TaxID=62062 RepID=A0A4W5PCC0_9TELE
MNVCKERVSFTLLHPCYHSIIQRRCPVYYYDCCLIAVVVVVVCLQEVLRNLVKRYVAAMIRDAKTEEGLTEENFKELKQDISSFRYEVMGMMKTG